MRLIKLALDGIELFKNSRFEIDLSSADRVVDHGAVYQIQKAVYTQNVIAIAGINATGKSTVLKLIDLAYRILMGNTTNLSYVPFPDALQKGFVLSAIFWLNEQFYYIKSNIKLVQRDFDLKAWTKTYDLHFGEETIHKLRRIPQTKRTVSDFDAFCEASNLYKRRSDISGIEAEYLFDDRSIVASLAKQSHSVLKSLYGEINNLGTIDSSIIQVFDSSIDYITEQKVDEMDLPPFGVSREYADVDGSKKPVKRTSNTVRAGGDFQLKFKSENEERWAHEYELQEILSAGTIRGSGMVLQAIQVLKSGGYFLVDEIESHLNKQLVGIIISLFNSKDTNPQGATLVFTTHYPEVLDFIQRKDNVYFLARNNEHYTEIIRYSDRIKRIENKKSEVFLSNYIKGTAPKYVEISALHRHISQIVKAKKHA